MLRLDNNIWGYNLQASNAPNPEPQLKQIQVITPLSREIGQNYELSSAVIDVLRQKNVHYASELASDFTFDITDNTSKLAGRWKVSLVTQSSLMDRIWRFFPYTRPYNNPHIAQVTVSKLGFFGRLLNPVQYVITSATIPVELITQLATKPAPFHDSFSFLARRVYQTIDPYWVSETNVQAAFRYVLQGSTLSLQPLSTATATEQEKEQNRQTARNYKEYCESEYGQHRVAFVASAFGVSLDDIIKQGLPLVPDHIFKMNVGACCVNLSDVQRLYNTFHNAGHLVNNGEYTGFEAWQLERKPLTKALPTVDSITQLPADIFNSLVDIVMPSFEQIKDAFVGRRIRSLAISAGNTQGQASVLNTSRNFFEFMHLYPELRKKEDWQNFKELLSQIATKKALYQKSTVFDKVEGMKNWHIGYLVPAPDDSNGQRRYYYANGFIDDGEGNLNYSFQPACQNYRFDAKPCPFIRAFRATATNPSSMDWYETIDADLNPFGSPSSLDPQSSFFVEKKYFDDRTIPLWYGYLIALDRFGANRDEFATRALSEYLRCIKAPGPTPAEVLQEATQLQTSTSDAKIAFLKKMAASHNINENEKISQDIFSIGHSLGGGLAGFDLYYFGARRARIPMPGYKFAFYGNQSIGMDTKKDAVFMQFGRENSALISLLGPRWEVHHHLEYGDFNPQVGESHFGTTGYNQAIDVIWLDHVSSVFEPLATATAKAITTLTTHSRRIGMAVAGKDYNLKQITPQILSQFDHSWWMGKELNSYWGYRVMRSSKLLEGMRRIVSVILYPFQPIIVKINNYFFGTIGHRNKNGLFYLRYRIIK